MATYTTRKGRVIAQVWIKPFERRAKTFPDMESAQTWSQRVEAELRLLRKSGTKVAEYVQTGGLPSTEEEVSALPRIGGDQAFCGIYFLFWRNRCVYVGQSIQIHVRVQEHRIRAAHIKQFDSYSWVLCARDELDKWERFYIEMLRPELNVTFNATRPRRYRYDARERQEIETPSSALSQNMIIS